MSNQKLVETIERGFIKKFGENTFLDLQEYNKETAIFNYSSYWDGYPQFSKKIGKEMSFLLKEFGKNKAEFEKPFFFHCGDYCIDWLDN